MKIKRIKCNQAVRGYSGKKCDALLEFFYKNKKTTPEIQQ
jgi:hypothetical protein